MNRIEAKFRQLRKNKQKAFIVFITGGYPNLNITKQLILRFAQIGVDIIEIGVPFSDPMADGPIIQEASQKALEKKINLREILNLVKIVRQGTQIPICLMTYYNPIFCFGERKFVSAAKNSGVDGLIVPDLPPDEAKQLIPLCRRANLDTIFFLSPTSPIERIKIIDKVSRGFIYYVSLTGVTGARKKLPQDLLENVKRIKKVTNQPVCVGFGVSSAKQVKAISRFADGVIVGSAIVKKIKENLRKKGLVKIVGKFTANLKNVRKNNFK